MGTPPNPLAVGDKPGSTPPPKSEEYVAATPANEVSFGFRNVTPPSPLYIQRDDRLVLQGSTLLASGDTLVLNARILLASPPGPPFGLKTAAEIATYNASFGAQVVTVQARLPLVLGTPDATVLLDLAEGYLLSVAIVASNANDRGSTFGRLWIQRSSAVIATNSSALVLLADYVTVQGPQVWPGGRVISPTESTGAVGTDSTGVPAAGADFNILFNTNRRTRIMSVHAQLTTSATVANRTPRLEIADGSNNIIWQSGNNNAQAASTTINYNWGAGCSAGQVDAFTFMAPLPVELYVVATSAVRSATANLQAGDQWTAAFIIREAWLWNM